MCFVVSPTYGHHGKPKSQVRLGAQEADEAEMSQLLSEEECSGLGSKGSSVKEVAEDDSSRVQGAEKDG